MKAGFVGLGALGRTMASRLISEGVELTVWNRTKEKASGLKARIAVNPAEVFNASDIVIVNLFDSEAVDEIISGEGGFLESSSPRGKLIVDTTTNSLEAVLVFHELLSAHGVGYLEAPVLGSLIPASKGMLTVLAGGPKESYTKALPYIQKLGSTIFHFERPGDATRMKLINNLMLGTFMAAIAEGLALAEASGIEPEKALDVLGAGGGRSLVLDAKRQKLLDRDFSNHFSTSLILKDLCCLQDMARSLHRPLLTGSMAREAYSMAMSRGLGDKDFSSVYEVFRSWGSRH